MGGELREILRENRERFLGRDWERVSLTGCWEGGRRGEHEYRSPLCSWGRFHPSGAGEGV